jgi:hypothetical protein
LFQAAGNLANLALRFAAAILPEEHTIDAQQHGCQKKKNQFTHSGLFLLSQSWLEKLRGKSGFGMNRQKWCIKWRKTGYWK